MALLRKDGGWGWLVVAAACTNCFLTDGVRYSYGLLNLEFLAEFNRGKGETSWTGSLLFGLLDMFAIVSSILISRYGCRTVAIAGSVISAAGFVASVFASSLYHLYFTFGILGGIGFSMMVISLHVVIIEYFEKKRSLAMGIAACGSGVGTIVFSPLAKWLIDQYGWRGTLLIEAGFILNGVACGLIMIPFPKNQARGANTTGSYTAREDGGTEVTVGLISSPDKPTKCQETMELENGRRNTKEADMEHSGETLTNGAQTITIETTDGAVACEDKSRQQKTRRVFSIELLKDFHFIIFCISMLLMAFAYMIPFIYLPDMLVSDGYSRKDAAWLLSYFGITNTFCRPVIGFLGDRSWTNRRLLFSVTLMSCGLFTLLFPFYGGYGSLVALCVLFGISAATWIIYLPLVLADVFGDERLGDALGLLMFMCAFPTFLGAPIAGWLYDAWRRYDIPFIVAGAEFVTSGLLVAIVLRLALKRK